MRTEINELLSWEQSFLPASSSFCLYHWSRSCSNSHITTDIHTHWIHVSSSHHRKPCQPKVICETSEEMNCAAHSFISYLNYCGFKVRLIRKSSSVNVVGRNVWVTDRNLATVASSQTVYEEYNHQTVCGLTYVCFGILVFAVFCRISAVNLGFGTLKSVRTDLCLALLKLPYWLHFSALDDMDLHHVYGDSGEPSVTKQTLFNGFRRLRDPQNI